MTSSWGQQTKYGEYEIVGAAEGKPHLLGEGSFGKAYEAVRIDHVAGKEIRKRVAIKVLNPEILASEAKRFQFIQELEALTEFQHPNLIHYIRCGEENGEIYYAMDLCRGGDLVHLVRRFGALPERVAAPIALQVAAGLREVHHRHRLVHRDIKPSNIMLADELEPELERRQLTWRFEQQESLCRVVDFGLVSFTTGDAPQRFVGSPMYASPEQIREQPVDGRCDIYALGMTLWYLVQGSGPLLDRSGRELTDLRDAMRRHLDIDEHEEYLPPHLSPEFRHILARMVAKHPEQRIANPAELQTVLREYLNRAGSSAETNFQIVHTEEPLESLYVLGEKIATRNPQPSYSARDKIHDRPVKLSVAAQVETGGDSQHVTVIAEHLRTLAGLSQQATLPDALVPIRSVVWAKDSLAYTEDLFPHLELAEVLRVRTATRRPVNFAEATHVLRPISEALDFLLQNGQESIALPCESVWLAGSEVATDAATPDLLNKPFDTWRGLQVCFSMVVPDPTLWSGHGSAQGASDSGQTMSSSLNLSPADLHPVPAFARLVYRILNGSEVAAAVQFAPEAYIATVALGHASNTLLRDLLSRQRPWLNTGVVLEELCVNEGVVLRGVPPPQGMTAISNRSHSSDNTARASSSSERIVTPPPKVIPKYPVKPIASEPAPIRTIEPPSRRSPLWITGAVIVPGLAVAALIWHFSANPTPQPKPGGPESSTPLGQPDTAAHQTSSPNPEPGKNPASFGDAQESKPANTTPTHIAAETEKRDAPSQTREPAPTSTGGTDSAEAPKTPTASTLPDRSPPPVRSIPEDVPDRPTDHTSIPPVSQPRWIFAESSRQTLIPNDLTGLDKDTLWRARNEIFARHGYIFSTDRGRALAASLGDTYRPVTSDQDAVSNSFNAVERANVELLKSLENSAPTTAASIGESQVWLFPDSSSRRLAPAELVGLDRSTLWRARNEIYARHGLIFSTDKGRAFAKSLGGFYHPSTASPDAVERSFNPTERGNVDLLKSLEDKK